MFTLSSNQTSNKMPLNTKIHSKYTEAKSKTQMWIFILYQLPPYNSDSQQVFFSISGSNMPVTEWWGVGGMNSLIPSMFAG